MTTTKLTKLQRLLQRRDYDGVLIGYVQTTAMDELLKEAYQSRRGYAIGTVRGAKILCVAGTRTATDWALNLIDGATPSSVQFLSNATASRLTKIALLEGVDAAVGHSRGGMLVAKMDLPNYMKLGLDAAMMLSPRDRSDMMNLYQHQPFDRFIARGGTNQKAYRSRKTPGGSFHFITRGRRQGTRTTPPPPPRARDGRGGGGGRGHNTER